MLGNISRIQKIYETNVSSLPKSAKVKAGAKVAATDTATVSTEARLLNMARRAIDAGDDVRASRVEELRARYLAGTLDYEAEDIAAKILNI